MPHCIPILEIDYVEIYFQKKNDIQATYYAVEWYLCAYTRTLPWDTVLRIWDMFLCEG